MLRSSICPELGLYNGAIGRVKGLLISGRGVADPRESLDLLHERALKGRFGEPPKASSALLEHPSCKGSIDAFGQKDAESRSPSALPMIIIKPQSFKSSSGLPLAPARAIGIQKSQSLALGRARADPRDAFCSGALCAALLRARALEGAALIAPASASTLSKFQKP